MDIHAYTYTHDCFQIKDPIQIQIDPELFHNFDFQGIHAKTNVKRSPEDHDTWVQWSATTYCSSFALGL
jgi:predicted secreted acid phosphatase